VLFYHRYGWYVLAHPNGDRRRKMQNGMSTRTENTVGQICHCGNGYSGGNADRLVFTREELVEGDAICSCLKAAVAAAQVEQVYRFVTLSLIRRTRDSLLVLLVYSGGNTATVEKRRSGHSKLVSKGGGHGTTRLEIVKKISGSNCFPFNARWLIKRPRHGI
jgi:hypothetical protein